MATEYTIHPISGKRIVKFQPTNHEPMRRGIDLKQIVTGNIVHEDATREVSFLERKPDEPGVWTSNWQMLYDAGFPVPPTLRQTEHGTLLITNLKHNGAELYGKGMFIEAQRYERMQQRIPFRPIDATFLEVFKKDRTTIHKQAQALANKATELSIVLPPDDMFELVLQTDGSWELMIVDIAFARRTSNKNEAFYENGEGVLNFMNDLINCYEYFKLLPQMPKRPSSQINQQVRSVFEPKRLSSDQL